ncbi:MAG: CHASE2 domain-containing protein, partial [Cyanobacteria bacterium P01_H01_bin.121]
MRTINPLDRWRRSRSPLLRQRQVQLPILLGSLAAITAVIGLKLLGGLEIVELKLYDQQLALRRDYGPDPRLVIIAVTEQDLQRQQHWPFSDRVIAQTIQTLQQHQPQVIGVDLFRDLPVPPGTQALHATLNTENVIAIFQLPTAQDPQGVPPPPVPQEKTAFNDVVLDADGVVRRALLFATSEGTAHYSLAFRVSNYVLEQEQIQPANHPTEPDTILWNAATLRPLNSTAGGYHRLDARGYQILLNYRTTGLPATIIPLTDLLAGRYDPTLIQDKIVLIGSTAPSLKDLFFTPFYSKRPELGGDLPGVLVHAHIVSQLLDAVTGHRSVLRPLPDYLEVLEIIAW